MSKYLIAGAALVGVAFLAKRVATCSGRFDFAKLIERMPDEAPPKWMFRNISAIRENTERMLLLLEHEHDEVPTPV